MCSCRTSSRYSANAAERQDIQQEFRAELAQLSTIGNAAPDDHTDSGATRKTDSDCDISFGPTTAVVAVFDSTTYKIRPPPSSPSASTAQCS